MDCVPNALPASLKRPSVRSCWHAPPVPSRGRPRAQLDARSCHTIHSGAELVLDLVVDGTEGHRESAALRRWQSAKQVLTEVKDLWNEDISGGDDRQYWNERTIPRSFQRAGRT